MSKQNNLPNDVKQECLWIVRGYRRRVNAYQAARREVLEGIPCRYRTTKDQKTGKYIRVYPPVSSAGTSRSAEEKALQLEAIEEWPETKRMRAVEWARDQIGADFENPESRKRLMEAVMISCVRGKTCPFERLGELNIGKTNFYKRRSEFLQNVAIFLELI